MNAMLKSFLLFLRQIWEDIMLVAVCVAAILFALFVGFGVPALETFLCKSLERQVVLVHHYLLFDLLLAFITPYMFCFASTLMMLMEFDENMTTYFAITPVGKRGYVISRLIFPAVFSFLVSVTLMRIFSLLYWPVLSLLTACFLTSLLSVVISLFIFSFAQNRVEGMAMGKMSGIILLGLPAPFFLPSNVQYLFSPLPSLWIAKYFINNSIVSLLLAFLTLVLWYLLLVRKFERKIA